MTRIMMNRPVYRHMPRAHNHMQKQTCMHKHIATNISSTDDAYEIQLALPGIDKSKIEMTISEDLLSIKMESEKNSDDKNYKLKQFDYSSFEKKFELPTDVDRNGIEANYQDGILFISLKKIEKTELQSKIEIS